MIEIFKNTQKKLQVAVLPPRATVGKVNATDKGERCFSMWNEKERKREKGVPSRTIWTTTLSLLTDFLLFLPPNKQLIFNNSPRRLPERHGVARAPGQEDARRGARLRERFFPLLSLPPPPFLKKKVRRKMKKELASFHIHPVLLLYVNLSIIMMFGLSPGAGVCVLREEEGRWERVERERERERERGRRAEKRAQRSHSSSSFALSLSLSGVTLSLSPLPRDISLSFFFFLSAQSPSANQLHPTMFCRKFLATLALTALVCGTAVRAQVREGSLHAAAEGRGGRHLKLAFSRERPTEPIEEKRDAVPGLSAFANLYFSKREASNDRVFSFVLGSGSRQAFEAEVKCESRFRDVGSRRCPSVVARFRLRLPFLFINR